jgi:MscS family membrane protein
MRTNPPKKHLAGSIRRYFSWLLLVVGMLFPLAAKAQTIPQLPTAESTQAVAPEDTLGRTTPRGTVLGFLSAARKNDNETATRYLNTRLRGQPAEELAHKLFVVLNQRLSSNLYQLSDRPEGSMADPLQPNLELVGTIPSSNGDVEILLERLDRKNAGSLWLFSNETLKSIPDLYNEVNAVPVASVLPRFLTETKIGNARLFEVVAFFIGMPLFYLLIGLLNRLFSRLVGPLRRRLRRSPQLPDPGTLPRPVRLLVLAFCIRWLLSRFSISLLGRQFWSAIASIITITASVWLFILLNHWFERRIRVRLARRTKRGAVSVVRLARSVVDLLVVFVGVLFALHHFGRSPTAVLAGLGVGGIAVALAAQKTLENFIGGTSVILDDVVRVGDMVQLGDMSGTVERIGMRSTQIRTLNRTLVSVPNGQLASTSLENIAMRDKFWFHQNLSLRKDTSSSQMRSFVESTTKLLTQYPNAEPASARVSFLRLGAFSLDVEIFAYIFAQDWPSFLQIQGELLLRIMEILEEADIHMAVQPYSVNLVAPITTNGDGPQTFGPSFAPDKKHIAPRRDAAKHER